MSTFTLRGHNVGVTALGQLDGKYLVSGDEEGSIAIWDYAIKKRLTHNQVASSRIQSLKVLKLRVNGQLLDILACQTRDNGLLMLDLTHQILQPTSEPQILTTFQTYPSLFSKGDAITLDQNQALLAYPSCIENHLVTIRLISDDLKTTISGTAQRYHDEMKKTCTIFDIKLKQGLHQDDSWNAYVAFEDGCLSVFTFNCKSRKTVPSLNTEGLDIRLVKTYDLGLRDFISAFDIINLDNCSIFSVCGSPSKDLVFLSDTLEPSSSPVINRVQLKHKGVSTITIDPTGETIVVGGWDKALYLFSRESRLHLGGFKHSRQLQDLIFVAPPYDNQALELCCASMHGVILTLPLVDGHCGDMREV